MDEKEFKTFDFMVNDEDEVMLLMYEREGEPLEAKITLSPEDNSAILVRRPGEEILLSDISNDIFDSLAEADKLLVCELNRVEDEDDTEIVHAYEADIQD